MATTIVVVIGGPIARTDIPVLCNLVHGLLEGSEAEVAVCDLGALVDPDAVAVDALARMQLSARRLGRELRLSHACRELRDLLALVGLCDVLPCGGLLGPRGQAEEREQGLGFEEEVETDDLPA